MKWTTSLALVFVLALAFGVAAESARTGTQVDEVVIVERESPQQIIEEMLRGEIDLYAHNESNAEVFETLKSHPELAYYTSFGSYSELKFNTVGPEFNDGNLNPFAVRRLREAMNWAIDRNYIAEELYKGLAIPKYTVLNPSFADYTRVVEKANELEQKYAYDFDRAEAVVVEEMEALGATKVNGKWHYKGSPVVIKLLIRIEDARLETGDYFADQLEKMGFETARDYRGAVEANPIWTGSDPWEGQWHVVTGGWVSPVVYRDQTHNFDQMYTTRVMPYPVYQALDTIPELDELSDRLTRKVFSSMEERNAILERVLELGFEDSPHIYTVDVMSYVPRRAEVSVASDLAGQVAGTSLWPSTLRRGDEVGGSVRIAVPAMLVDPWNPIAGSNYTYDQLAIRATMDRGTIVDPYTGNYWAHRIERADVFVEAGLPVERTLDWVDLTFVDEIVVPEDAWADWDASEQRFITAGEKFPEGATARRRSVVYYPWDFFDTVKWHDGSPVTLGDFMFWFIVGFDRGKPESPFFDESVQADVEASLKSFKGMRILSEDPLIIEAYSDSWALDAEFMAADYFPGDINYGPGAWHNIALGMMLEEKGEAAFSNDKATKLEVEQIGFNSGPTLSMLAAKLNEAQANGYIPYEKVLSQYIDSDEVAARYGNLGGWYAKQRHFHLGTGPMYLDAVYPVERIIVLKRNEAYPDSVDKWMMFDEPRIPEVEIERNPRVVQGEETAFDINITFGDEPYRVEDLLEVKYVIVDSRGVVALSGQATALEDGRFRVDLSADETALIPVGSNTIDVMVLSKLVGGAEIESSTFVTTP